jgi:hypothetical protein
MVRVLIGIFSIFVMANPCFAEMRQQQQKLFKINIPDGWSVEETATRFTIIDPKGEDGIAINFGPMAAKTQDEAMQKIKQTLSFMAGIYKTNEEIKEVQLDNVKALQLDFIWPDPKGASYGCHIACYNNGFDYQIVYSSADAKKKALMEETVKSFRFL